MPTVVVGGSLRYLIVAPQEELLEMKGSDVNLVMQPGPFSVIDATATTPDFLLGVFDTQQEAQDFIKTLHDHA